MLVLNPDSRFSERAHVGPLELGEGLIWLPEAGLWIVSVWSPADMAGRFTSRRHAPTVTSFQQKRRLELCHAYLSPRHPAPCRNQSCLSIFL